MDFAAAAAAVLLQLCPTLCDPIDGSPLGSPIHGIFQAKVLEWGAIAFSDMDSSKMILMNFFRTAVETQTLRTDLWTRCAGGGGRGWDVWSNMETDITICKIDSLWEFSI